jgi:flagella basal body P-ring formation protein FlgA
MRRFVRTGALWFCFVTVSLWGAEKTATIRFLGQATVTGPDITLGEIALVTADEKAFSERLDRVIVVRAAPPGQKVTITQSAVKIALGREGYSLEGFRLEGADSTLVLTETQEVKPDQLLEAAKAFILSQTGDDPGNLEIKLLGPLKNVVVPSGRLEIHYRPALVGQYEGTQILTAELTVDGRDIRVVPVRLETKVFHTVVLTSKAVKKGDKFTTDNVILGKMLTSRVLRGSLQHLKDVLGRTAAFDLGAGIPVRFSEIDDPPVIHRGTMIQAFVESGNVEIMVHARAIEDGKAGEEIKVENTDSHKVLWAKVVDENRVLIDPTKQ